MQHPPVANGLMYLSVNETGILQTTWMSRWGGQMSSVNIQKGQYSIKLFPNATVFHYIDVTMSVMASQITSLTIVCSSVYSGAYQRKHQSPASLVFVWGIHRWPVNSPHKAPVTRKMVPFNDVIMQTRTFWRNCNAEFISIPLQLSEPHQRKSISNISTMYKTI